MAGSSLFALIDDIATILDDVVVMSKLAAKKTAGVLGDDLALNAQQIHGIRAERELPVIYAVARGSAINKMILIPVALLLSALFPKLVMPLLMLGGIYLCYEGVEKLVEKWIHTHDLELEEEALVDAFLEGDDDLVKFEKDKIKGAIKTDFILSAEIIVIALGTLGSDATFLDKLFVLVVVAVIMTFGVYGIVAAIVKLDDLGFYLETKPGPVAKKAGLVLINAAPKLMKLLSIVGTIAMFLVGGSIIVHGLHAMGYNDIPNFIEHVAEETGKLEGLTKMTLEGLFGVLVGMVAVAIQLIFEKIVSMFRSSSD